MVWCVYVLVQLNRLRIRRFGVRVPTGAPFITQERRERSARSRRFAVSTWQVQTAFPVPVRGDSKIHQATLYDVSKLLGHSTTQTTTRYAHHERGALLRASEQAASQLARTGTER